MWHELLVGAGVFGAYAGVDFLYARYLLAVTQQRAARAATLSGTIYLLLALGVLAFTQRIWTIAPAVLGAWLGTFWSVRRAADPE